MFQLKFRKTGLLCTLLTLAQLGWALGVVESSCKYGERGSLTAICTNATVSTFRDTIYHFDHLDETLICAHCTLTHLKMGSFDINGNRIQVLNLTNSAIETIEEHSFTGLVFLETLYLSNNSINLVQPGAFHGARKIKKLYMNHALIAPLPNLAFQGLMLLTDLTLKNNSLYMLENQTFEGLKNLRNLDLSFNSLRELNNSLSALKNLEVLLLSNNNLVKISATDLHGLSKLLKVDLSHNFFSALNLNLGQPNSLKKLNLSNSQLGNELVKFGVFHGLYNLEILDLSLNWIQLIPKQIFQELHALRELFLSHNSLVELTTGSFTGLPYLRFLNVSHNRIKHVYITGRLMLHSLHVIDISNNKILELDFIHFLRQAPLINKLYLEGNMISCQQLRRITAGLKTANIQSITDPMDCSELDTSEQSEINEELNRNLTDIQTSGSALTALKITILLIVIALVGLLIYVQFFILNRREY